MLLFFDLDGPILDVSPRYVAIHQQLLQQVGVTGMPGNTYWQRKRARRPEEEILREIGATEHCDAYQRRRLELIETWEYLELDQCWPWTKIVLEELSAAHTLVIVTVRAIRAGLIRELDHLGLSCFFSDVLSTPAGKDVGRQKADLIEEYLTALSRKADGSYIVGDTEADIKAGNLTGLGTIAVLCGIRDKDHLAVAGADHIVNDIRELILLPGFRS